MVKFYFTTVLFVAGLVWLLIPVGVYVRLNGAGLACPDWPLCYGQIIPPEGRAIALEVGHRFLAVLLGLFLVILAIVTFSVKKFQKFRTLAATNLLLVILQGGIGGLTVLWKLSPVSVIGHLIGGNLLLGATIFWVCQIFRSPTTRDYATSPRLKKVVLWMILIFCLMLVSGGLNSSTYSGYICRAFPLCNVESPLSFSWDEASQTFQSNSWNQASSHFFLPQNYLEVIHLSHRLVVIIGSILLIGLAKVSWLSRLSSTWKILGYTLIFTILLEMVVGIFNAIFSVPILLSLSHTTIASCITVILAIALNFSQSKPNESIATIKK